MNRAWFLVLIMSAVALAGCLQFPDSEARKQTVQQGTPQPIDPKTPKKAGGKTARPPTENTPTGSPAGAAPAQAKSPPLPLTADQVDEDNPEEAAQSLYLEIEEDLNNNHAPTRTGVLTNRGTSPSKN